MNQGPRPFGAIPNLGPATKWLCIVTAATSVAFAIATRFGLGVGTQDLALSAVAILRLELWRLVTYPFVVTDGMGSLSIFGLVISLVVLYFFGRSLEGQWGSREFFRFFMLSSIGAGLLTVPFAFLINFIPTLQDTGYGSGPRAAIDAMLVWMALSMPNSNILFGFVIPMRVRTAIYVLIGLELVMALLSGVSSLSITLGGLVMGYLLTTGIWRPERLIARAKTWRSRRRRRGLYVVPPRDDKTLH